MNQTYIILAVILVLALKAFLIHYFVKNKLLKDSTPISHNDLSNNLNDSLNDKSELENK